ncbi:YkgJ family cysteine cluster protein [Novosphingobium naphthalenivorans]|uniref:YkgJ family cysteine cluster protein n=1 Tax=Novosphingobium naphthalenivorans TaxID=273168 RepID=UPI001471BEE7|nr:YkgJ family cysteine cluster protein [Novosphingobium naphthalenivorans]
MEQLFRNEDGHTDALENRDSPFGFTCGACSRCCYDKKIQINPFEAASLAGYRGISTARLLNEFTLDGAGIYLAQSSDGACVFLGVGGCSVHPVRPLVCRLYPLGRIRHANGSEDWELLAPHPESEGQFDIGGTIADYLAAQDALELISIADSYVDWVNRARVVLATCQQDAEGEEVLDASLFDLDLSVSDYCAHHGLASPECLKERQHMHLHILGQELEELEGGHNGQKAS